MSDVDEILDNLVQWIINKNPMGWGYAVDLIREYQEIAGNTGTGDGTNGTGNSTGELRRE